MVERVLIVDDNVINAKLARYVLAGAGFDVVAVPDAHSAMRAVESYKPALILMDLQLPDVDGLTLTRRLKSSAQTRDIPVVAVTAYAMKGDAERALAAGCDGYIAKPIDAETLPGTVKAYLNRRSVGQGGLEQP